MTIAARMTHRPNPSPLPDTIPCPRAAQSRLRRGDTHSNTTDMTTDPCERDSRHRQAAHTINVTVPIVQIRASLLHVHRTTALFVAFEQAFLT